MDNSWQGRVVYSPYLPSNGTVVNNPGRLGMSTADLWYSQTAPSGTQCSIAAPCTKAQMLSEHPNMGVHNPMGPTAGNYGFLLFRVQPQSNSNVDKLTISIDGVTPVNKVSDFEPGTSTTTAACMSPQTYTGSVIEPCTYTVTGNETGNPVLVASTPVASGDYTNNVAAGMATATVMYAGDDNHAASNGSNNFTINPAPVTAQAGSYSGLYDGSVHAIARMVSAALD